MDRTRLTPLTDRLGGRLEQTRLGAAIAGVRSRAFPDHWALLTGHLVAVTFIVCMLTGIPLLLVYEPSIAAVRYDGPFAPLHGMVMSRALESTLELSFEVRGGLLLRQLHHWSASLMLAALLVHILRMFFTGGFRRPRELGWLAMWGLLLIGMAAGLTGVTLPDDMLSGSSLAVLDGIVKAVPFIGTWLSSLIFQGTFRSGAIATSYPLHVLVLPVLMLLVAAVAVRSAWRHRPPQPPGPGRTATAVVGRPPAVAGAKLAGLYAAATGVMALIAATVTVNPVWLYGPADPGSAAAGAGSVWWMAFMDGAQRLVPPGWELIVADGTLTLALLVPLGLCGLFFAAAMGYPLLERWVTGDAGEHHLLTRPRETPVRTGIGAAAITFYVVLWAAAGSDVIAMHFSLGVEGVVQALQAALLLGPIAAYALTKRVCLGLQRKDREVLLHGYETGRIVRRPGGEFVEVPAPVDVYERWRLVSAEQYRPVMLRPDASGRIRLLERVRVVLSRWFFEDRLEPIAHAELAAQAHVEQDALTGRR